MKKVICAVVALAVTAMVANAAIVTDFSMRLSIDAGGNATLTNTTASNLNVDSYEIWSASGKCSPTGWYSISDAVEADDANGTNFVSAALTSGALTFGEASATTALVSELNLTKSARFKPSMPWGIGKPVSPASAGDITFYYTKPGVVGTKFLGEKVIVPEPATMALLGLGAMGLLARKRR